MFRKVTAYVIILAGILLFLSPTIKDRYESYQQRQILQAWEDNLQRIENVPPDAPNASEDEADASAVKPTPTSDTPSPPQSLEEKLQARGIGKQSIEGVLTIAKINLKLPIITDATQAHLSLSVASILHTGKPGQIGNYAIAGHRNRTYGKNFNRLDEVMVGDRVQVQTDKGTYTYIVKSKQYVLPTQVDVLRGNSKDSEITLITCHPLVHPTKRIVIKGTLIREKS